MIPAPTAAATTGVRPSQRGTGRALRRDAAENADRLLAAALRNGLASGRQVPMAQIAADAGVGVATLYRRFPTREALVGALQVRAFELLLDIVDRARQDAPTGLVAVERFLIETFDSRDQLVLPLHGAPLDDYHEAGALQRRLHSAITTMIERGHEDGTVRYDVNARTVIRFGAAMAQPLGGPMGSTDVAAEQRLIFLRGISTHETT